MCPKLDQKWIPFWVWMTFQVLAQSLVPALKYKSCTVIGSSTEILMLTITNEAALTVALLSPWKKINLEDTGFGVVIVAGGKILKQGKESNLGTLQAIKISSTVNGTCTDDNS